MLLRGERAGLDHSRLRTRDENEESALLQKIRAVKVQKEKETSGGFSYAGLSPWKRYMRSSR